MSFGTGPIKVVDKLWGHEEILVNEPEYCCKRLYLNPGFQCSLHYHRIKKETFIVEKGAIRLKHGEEIMVLDRYDAPRTILPNTPHRFNAFRDPAVILEVSTHHDDEDVVRLEPSRKLP